MKKILSISAFVLLVSLTIFSSCKKDDPEYQSPVLNLVQSPGYIYQDTQWKMDSVFWLGFQASSDAANEVNITNVKITAQYLDKFVVHFDSTMNTSSFNYNKWYYVLGLEGQETWKIIVTDSRGQVTEKGFTITMIK